MTRSANGAAGLLGRPALTASELSLSRPSPPPTPHSDGPASAPHSDAPASVRGPWAQLVLFVLVFVGMGWAWVSGTMSAIDLPLIRAWVDSAGAWAPLAYLLAFALLQPLGVTAHLFLVVAGVIWETPVAIALSQMGLMLSSLTCYGSGRAMAPDSLRAQLPLKIRQMEARLKRGGVLAVIAVRIPFFSFFLASAFMGALRVPLRNYLLGSFIGMLPVGIAEVWMAHELVDRFGGL